MTPVTLNLVTQHNFDIGACHLCITSVPAIVTFNEFCLYLIGFVMHLSSFRKYYSTTAWFELKPKFDITNSFSLLSTTLLPTKYQWLASIRVTLFGRHFTYLVNKIRTTIVFSNISFVYIFESLTHSQWRWIKRQFKL